MKTTRNALTAAAAALLATGLLAAQPAFAQAAQVAPPASEVQAASSRLQIPLPKLEALDPDEAAQQIETHKQNLKKYKSQQKATQDQELNRQHSSAESKLKAAEASKGKQGEQQAKLELETVKNKKVAVDKQAKDEETQLEKDFSVIERHLKEKKSKLAGKMPRQSELRVEAQKLQAEIKGLSVQLDEKRKALSSIEKQIGAKGGSKGG